MTFLPFTGYTIVEKSLRWLTAYNANDVLGIPQLSTSSEALQGMPQSSTTSNGSIAICSGH